MDVLGSFSSLLFSLFFRSLSFRCRSMSFLLCIVHQELKDCNLSAYSQEQVSSPENAFERDAKPFTLPHNNTRDRDGKRLRERHRLAGLGPRGPGCQSINWPLATIQILGCLKEARKVFSTASSMAAWRFPFPFPSDPTPPVRRGLWLDEISPKEVGWERGKGQQYYDYIDIETPCGHRRHCQLWSPPSNLRLGLHLLSSDNPFPSLKGKQKREARHFLLPFFLSFLLLLL